MLARAPRDVLDEVHPMGLLGALRLGCLAAAAALLALLCWVLLAASGAVLRDRRRHRALLSLLAHGDPKVPGALVVDHPAAAAYCVPGLRSQIVISAGALDLLDQANWRPCWPTSGPTSGNGTIWCCSRSPRSAAPSPGPPRCTGPARRWPCSSRCWPTTMRCGTARPGNWSPR